MIICIDPGHGKNTSGKRSPDGMLREYEFNRAVAKRLKRHLERHGIGVMYSCDIESPLDTPLGERCRNANNAKADLYISIHANAAGSGQVWMDGRGWEIFHCAGSTKGHALAEAIHKASIPFLGIKDRGIKTNGLYVTKHTNMPAVLIEHGFYDNKAECELLKTSEFREKCAVADAKGILSYIGIAWKEEGSLDPTSAPIGAPSPQGEGKELITPNDVVWQLSEWGIVTDANGMLAEMEANPNGRLYWLARKVVNRMKMK